jgi:hypothetical protein
MEKVVKLFSVSKAVSELKINEGYFSNILFQRLEEFAITEFIFY